MRLIDMSAPSVKSPMPRISMAVAITNESISPASTGTSTKLIAITIRLMEQDGGGGFFQLFH
ncbi:MAG: hypothetical protein ACLTG0_14420 [Oscillibacter sp.]